MKEKNNINPSSILYEEWIPISKFILVLFIFIITILITAIILTFFYDPIDKIPMLAIGIPFIAFFILIYINYRGMKIIITNDLLIVRFGIFNKKEILISDILTFDNINVKFGDYLGLGVRIGFDSSLAFVTNFGDAIKLSYANSKLFVFSTNNHQEVSRIIAERKKPD
ncbi:MAG: hypothetical protein ACFFDW_07830 [Candidatus Thorarchaeota archaeon]